MRGAGQTPSCNTKVRTTTTTTTPPLHPTITRRQSTPPNTRPRPPPSPPSSSRSVVSANCIQISSPSGGSHHRCTLTVFPTSRTATHLGICLLGCWLVSVIGCWSVEACRRTRRHKNEFEMFNNAQTREARCQKSQCEAHSAGDPGRLCWKPRPRCWAIGAW